MREKRTDSLNWTDDCNTLNTRQKEEKRTDSLNWTDDRNTLKTRQKEKETQSNIK